MAFYTDTISRAADASGFARLTQVMARAFTTITDAQNRTSQVARMQDLSDADLAKLGVRRADIVRHVYRDIYYV
jgi:hypothetical protein